MMRCMLMHAKLEQTYWPYAFEAAIYIWNRSTSKASKHGLTPVEYVSKEPPDLTMLRVWGCIAYVEVEEGRTFTNQDGLNKSHRQSLDKRAEKGIFIGYGALSGGTTKRGWKVLVKDPFNDKKLVIRTSMSVRFNEQRFLPDWDETVWNDKMAIIIQKRARLMSSAKIEQGINPETLSPEMNRTPNEQMEDWQTEENTHHNDEENQSEWRSVPENPMDELIAVPQTPPRKRDPPNFLTGVPGGAPDSEPPATVIRTPVYVPVPPTSEPRAMQKSTGEPEKKADELLPEGLKLKFEPEVRRSSRIQSSQTDSQSAESAVEYEKNELKTEFKSHYSRADESYGYYQSMSETELMQMLVSNPGGVHEGLYTEDFHLNDQPMFKNQKYASATSAEYVFAVGDYAKDYDAPADWEEAISGPDKIIWGKSLEKEWNQFENIKKVGEWKEREDCPVGTEFIDPKVVVTVKVDDATEKITEHKVRITGKGFQQRNTYADTFAPVTRYETIRLLFAIIAAVGMNWSSVDFTGAFLNSLLGPMERIALTQPKGGKVYYGKNGTPLVFYLLKALYGLKQAGRAWYDLIVGLLLKLGFEQCPVEPCLFNMEQGDFHMIMAMWVDDLAIGDNNMETRDKVLKELSDTFHCTTQNNPRKYLAFVITKEQDGGITLSNEFYVKKALQKYKFEDVKTRLVPMLKSDLTFEMPEDYSEEQEHMKSRPYRQIIGVLMYLVSLFRVDLAFSVCFLARFSHNPSRKHWDMLMKILGYTKRTADQKLTYHPDPKKKVRISYETDSDYATDTGDFISVTGFNGMINGVAYTYKSKKQTEVATSTAHAEYMALYAGVIDAIYSRQVIEFLGFKQEEPTYIGVDNSAAVKISKNPVSHSKSKSWNIKYHLIRQAFKNGQVIVHDVNTEDNSADMNTKPLEGKLFFKHRAKAMGQQL